MCFLSIVYDFSGLLTFYALFSLALAALFPLSRYFSLYIFPYVEVQLHLVIKHENMKTR